MTRTTWGAAVLALTLAAPSAEAGGRARVQVTGLSRQVVVGEGFELALRVRPETWSRARNIEPLVIAEREGLRVTATAVALRRTDHYRARLVLPSAGTWRIHVDSRFCETVMDPRTVEVVTVAEARSPKSPG